MIDAHQMLLRFLRGFRRLSGAQAATLFIPPSGGGSSQTTLLHDGNAPPIGELASEAAALAFHESYSSREPSRTDASPSSGPILRIPGRASGSWLIPLPGTESGWSAVDHPRPIRGASTTRDPVGWVGLRLRPSQQQSGTDWSGLDGRGDLLEWICQLGAAMAAHATEVAGALRDPITGLPDRVGLRATLSDELARSSQAGAPLALLFINPDDFSAVNDRLGRQEADRVLREITHRLRGALRASGPVARYGGAIFAAVLPETTLEGARALASQTLAHLSEPPYAEGALRLGFSIGLAVAEPRDEEERVDAHEMMRRADQALDEAKRRGGGCVAGHQGSSSPERQGVDRLSGIFTGNVDKDYRNMVLLSDALDAIAVQPRFEGLAAEAVERLYSVLRPDRIGLYRWSDGGQLELVKGLTRSTPGGAGRSRLETVDLDASQLEHLRRVASGRDPEPPPSGGGLEVAVPLWAGDRAMGALYLDGRSGAFAFDSSDRTFLRALATQLAVALDRARLSEAEAQRRENERTRLRTELQQLRHALRQARLVYRSREMKDVLASARRVAATDATVLITGESGTGKELLAGTLHGLSPRRTRPMVVVDCGAIAPSQIESELFGREPSRGEESPERPSGRLSEADGGTLLLDEVSELPLEIQARLLRFVQDKQFIPRGSERPVRLDVRLLAATNRDLAREVADGRFREDLFHRLNVVRLEIPPLRERPDDIPHLARHFLELYALQYQKRITRLSGDAEELILAYSWPGNVRELQNRILQGVILCEDEELGPAELQIPRIPDAAAGDRQEVPAAPGKPKGAGQPLGRPWAVRPPTTGRGPKTATSLTTFGGDPMERLRMALALQVEAALATRNHEAFPLGKWLAEDLVLEARATAGGVARRAAQLVGIPETTFRRRLRRASDRARAGFSPRTGNWDQVRVALADLLRELGEDGKDVAKITQRVLLEEILARVPQEPGTGAKLLGVTPPTYRSRIATLRTR